MTIHFFTKGDANAGSSRQRAFLVAEELNKKGIKALVHWPPIYLISQTRWPKKFKLLIVILASIFSVKKEDIIYLQRTIYNKFFFTLIVFYKSFLGRKMIFDFDDAIYLHSFFKTKVLTKLADIVIVGSYALADWAKKYNKNVYIIPTSISFATYEKYSNFKRKQNKKFIIGWIGYAPVHYENLKILKPVFEELLKQGLRFKFILVGSLGSQKIYSLFKINGLDVKFIDSLNWSDQEAIPKMIQNFDTGLMPLVNTEWNRGKCAFKSLEYMACGVPVIVSPVGESNYLIKDGINGFLANSPEEWSSKIKMIYNNPELIKRIRKKAQETIKEKYSYEANILKLIEILKKI